MRKTGGGQGQGASFPALDWFRLLAAALVVGIHTSPLASFTAGGDFILTRIIGRIGVPFFLMVTGYFMEPWEKGKTWDWGKRYLKKMAVLYGVSILLYLPLNLYSGYFRQGLSVWGYLKDLFFDGTFYHLWYLPAAMIGVILTGLLVRTAGLPAAMVISCGLYGIGLLGDSYYGITEGIPLLRRLFDLIFRVSDYTRNGLFLAPVFLLEGLWIRRHDRKGLLPCSLLLLAAGAGMMAEGLAVRRMEWSRHDSMYLLLPVVMYALFQLLLAANRGEDRRARDLSLAVYLIHPWMIVAARAAGKLLHLEWLFIDQSLFHYLTVLTGSVICGLIFALWQERMGMKRREKNMEDRNMWNGNMPDGRMPDRNILNKNMPVKKNVVAGGLPGFEISAGKRAWAEIDLDAICHNSRVLKDMLPDSCRLMAVVKADGYGHGAVPVAEALSRTGVSSFAVAALEEGIRLRQAGIRGEILILGYTDPARADILSRYDLSQTVVDLDYGRRLDTYAADVKVHIGIDTGMHRLGIPAEAVEQAEELYACRHLRIQGIFSHLCVSDSLSDEDVVYTHWQITRFYRLISHLREKGLDTGQLHIQASFGIINYPDLPCSLARAGIALYGALSPEENSCRVRPDLRPALSLHARIGSVKEIHMGDCVSYGRIFTAESDMRIAAVTIGYADGVPRSLSGAGGWVLIHGKKAPVIGRVCMDQLMADVSGIPEAASGDRVTLIGRDGREEITCEMLSAWCGTIPNEILSRLGSRIARIYGAS